MEESQKRIKTDRLILFGIVALILVLTVAYTLLQKADDLSLQYVTNTVLLGFLGVADVILIFALVFLLLRNLVKLVTERRREILGSRFRTKLVVTFIGLCLVPSVLLFTAALSLIERSIERWFNTPVTEVTENAQQIAQALYDEHKKRDRRMAENLADFVSKGSYLQGPRKRQLLRQLQRRLLEYKLDYAAVYETGGLTASAAHPRLPVHDLAEPPQSLLARSLDGEPFDWVDDLGSGKMVRSGVPVRSRDGRQVLGVAVAGSYVGKELAALTANVSRASENYRQIKAQKGAIKRVYIFFFALITLLIIFGAMWIGLYLARQITVPIQMLAEGTRAVAGGDLDYRVDLKAGDELGILVDSFNTMTAELKARREEVEQSAAEIRERNLELEERKRYIETLVENVPVGVVSLSDKGRITTSNKAARQILRIQPEQDISGLSHEEIFSRGRLPEVGTVAGECLKGDTGTVYREIHSSVDGEPMNLSLTVTPLSEGSATGVLIVMEDVTRLIKAQKMAAWQEVARRMAHEIKNPLTPIQLSAQRILKKFRSGAEDFDQALREGTETIVREVKTLKSLVNEFSGFARMPAVNPMPSDVHKIIDSALVLYQGTLNDVSFRRDFDGDLPVMHLDREQMKRVFINLIENALAAMQRRGEIHIGTRYLQQERLTRIEVADTGPGIPSEDKEKLFLPYFSTRRRGTGLGLAIVNRIVSDHNGYIRVEDNRPHGARFVIELPSTQQVSG